MSPATIDAKFLYEMIANGCRNLCRSEKIVNDLNVFPVPDGDTGSNMAKTLLGFASCTPGENETISSFMSRVSKSVLMSARGNSGVILSQYVRGLSKGAPDSASMTCQNLLTMIKDGVDSAYGAVTSPVEGTMLTVIREAYEAIQNRSDIDNFETFFSLFLEETQKSLRHTPELLPVLKEAGVVDSGGMGIYYIFEGMLAYLKGKIIDGDDIRESDSMGIASHSFGPDSVLEYGYCTEFILQLMHAKTNIATFSIRNMISYLETVGESIVAVQDDDIVKVHVHTFTPEKVLAFARSYGEFVTIKIENMSVQHNENTENASKTTEKIRYAVVAVASGEGTKDYFAEIGAHRVIDGGQTQNPSTRDFLDAFSSLNAEYIIVLPNNSNIIMTAEQAAQMYSDAEVRVLPTKSMAEGYSALSMMNTWADDVDSFISDMEAGYTSVTTGSVTRAVHDALINGIEIKENHFMGMVDGDIVCTASTNEDAVMCMLEKLPDISLKEVITIFYGNGVSEDDANALLDRIINTYSHIECGIIYGGQNVYDYYMAIE